MQFYIIFIYIGCKMYFQYILQYRYYTQPDEADILIFQVSFRSNKSSPAGVHTSDTLHLLSRVTLYHCIHIVTRHPSLQSCKMTPGTWQAPVPRPPARSRPRRRARVQSPQLQAVHSLLLGTRHRSWTLGWCRQERQTCVWSV